MKTKFLLLVAAVLLAVALPAKAEVLIYRGSGTVLSTPGASFPPTIELYFVFDIAAKKGGSIVFFKASGTKSQIGGTTSDLHMTTSPLPGGDTARLVSTAAVSETLPNYSEILTYFRGTQKTLLVATGAFNTTRNEPRTMKGIQFQARESNGEGAFLEGRFALKYLESSTIEANNATKTLQQVVDDLKAALTDKGYNPI